jgi:hypothetical protein
MLANFGIGTLAAIDNDRVRQGIEDATEAGGQVRDARNHRLNGRRRTSVAAANP